MATIIAQGSTGELQKIVVVKLSKASQNQRTNVPNIKALRRAPLRNGCERTQELAPSRKRKRDHQINEVVHKPVCLGQLP